MGGGGDIRKMVRFGKFAAVNAYVINISMTEKAMTTKSNRLPLMYWTIPKEITLRTISNKKIAVKAKSTYSRIDV